MKYSVRTWINESWSMLAEDISCTEAIALRAQCMRQGIVAEIQVKSRREI